MNRVIAPDYVEKTQVAGQPGERNRDRIRVALVQTRSDLGTETYDPRDSNLERGLDDIRRAAAQGADLVIFGEMYLSGYRTDQWLHKWATVLDPPDKHVDALVEAARRSGVHVIMGLGSFGAGMPGDVYNTALLVGPDGAIGAYRKTHVCAFLSSAGVSMERSFYSPGRDLPVFDTALGRLGIHICYDIAFPEVARCQTLQGADILINVSASASGFEEFWEHTSFVRAVENGSWYIVCSVVGIQRGDRLFGKSRVIDPYGRVIAAGKLDEEDFVVADIDLSVARAVRSKSHHFNTRQPELYRAITEPTRSP